MRIIGIFALSILAFGITDTYAETGGVLPGLNQGFERGSYRFLCRCSNGHKYTFTSDKNVNVDRCNQWGKSCALECNGNGGVDSNKSKCQNKGPGGAARAWVPKWVDVPESAYNEATPATAPAPKTQPGQAPAPEAKPRTDGGISKVHFAPLPTAEGICQMTLDALEAPSFKDISIYAAIAVSVAYLIKLAIDTRTGGAATAASVAIPFSSSQASEVRFVFRTNPPVLSNELCSRINCDPEAIAEIWPEVYTKAKNKLFPQHGTQGHADRQDYFLDFFENTVLLANEINDAEIEEVLTYLAERDLWGQFARCYSDHSCMAESSESAEALVGCYFRDDKKLCSKLSTKHRQALKAISNRSLEENYFGFALPMLRNPIAVHDGGA